MTDRLGNCQSSPALIHRGSPLIVQVAINEEPEQLWESARVGPFDWTRGVGEAGACRWNDAVLTKDENRHRSPVQVM